MEPPRSILASYFKNRPLQTLILAYLEDVELSLRARQNGFICRWSEGSGRHHAKHATAKTMGNFKGQTKTSKIGGECSSPSIQSLVAFWRQYFDQTIRNFSGLLKQL